jgi:spoIIIJ-associated protein
VSKIKFTGRSEEDAVRKAADTLGVDAAGVQYKIVSRAGGLLGLLGQTVTIEVAVGESEPEERSPQPLPQRRSPVEEEDDSFGNSRDAAAPADDAEAQPQSWDAPHQEAPAGEGERTPQEQRRREGGERRERSGRRDRRDGRGPREGGDDRPRRDRGDRGPRPPRPDRDAQAPRTGRPSDGEDAVEETVVDPEVFARKLEHARTFISDIIRIAGGEVEIAATQQNAEIAVSVTGKLPEWLGRSRGHVMDSLQFLANKVVNRFPPRYRVLLAVEGQKEERQMHLEAMAADVAKRVEETGQPIWILPMSAKERRAVHMAVSQVPTLATTSVGDGAARRVCVHKVEKQGE